MLSGPQKNRGKGISRPSTYGERGGDTSFLEKKKRGDGLGLFGKKGLSVHLRGEKGANYLKAPEKGKKGPQIELMTKGTGRGKAHEKESPPPQRGKGSGRRFGGEEKKKDADS